jgi:hypothetical protein
VIIDLRSVDGISQLQGEVRDGVFRPTNKKRRGDGLPVVTGLKDAQMISFLGLC